VRRPWERRADGSGRDRSGGSKERATGIGFWELTVLMIVIALFPVIVWAYVRLARREEREMLERFREEYGEYRRRVPMFFPRRGEWRRLLDETRASSGERL